MNSCRDWKKPSAKPAALSAAPDVFIERYIRRAKHIEVQILGDQHGNHRSPVGTRLLGPAPPSESRRNRPQHQSAAAICASESANAAVRLCAAVGYRNAGTVEFLLDLDRDEFYFIEVNPRIQVEHTVTEVVTGFDIVKSQILIAQGHKLHEPPINIPAAGQDRAARLRHAVPHHHGRSAEPFHSRLRPIDDLPLGRGIRHPPRRRHRLQRGGHHSLFRFAAGEAHRLRPDLRRGRASHGPLAQRIPRPRRQDQYPVPGKPDPASDVHQGRGDHHLHR